MQEMIHERGARLLLRPPYSPDLNPIDKVFSKLKALLRKAAERAVEGLWTTIGKVVDAFTPTERNNYLAVCGYDATRAKIALPPPRVWVSCASAETSCRLD